MGWFLVKSSVIADMICHLHDNYFVQCVPLSLSFTCSFNELSINIGPRMDFLSLHVQLNTQRGCKLYYITLQL